MVFSLAHGRGAGNLVSEGGPVPQSGWAPAAVVHGCEDEPGPRSWSVAAAAGEEDRVGWWTERVVPRLADQARSPTVQKARRHACAGLSGDVIEIGFGTGLNVEHYPSAVRGVWAVEPSDVAWKIAEPRIAASGVPIQRAGLDGQRLDLPDARFDAALSTLTMCTIPDLDAALAETRRVLRPGGTLHFVEHGRSPDARVAGWQDRLQPVYGPIFGGCHLNRPIADYLGRSGLEVEELREFYVQWPKSFAYAFLGRARKSE